MELYSRVVTVRQPSRNGRKVFTLVREYVATDDITPYNRRKRNLFLPDDSHPADGFLPDEIVRIRIKDDIIV